MLGTAVLIALVLLDGQPASAALIVLGFALGARSSRRSSSFTASWRRFLVNGEAGGLHRRAAADRDRGARDRAGRGAGPGFGGAIAPIGPSLVIGAFVFGIGMQLANGCGSGTLYTAGGGSGRMLITLACFIVGSVIGSLHLPAVLALGGIDPILASNYLGPWGGLAVTLASIAAAALVIATIARWRGASFMPRPLIIIGAVIIGAALDRRVPRRPPSLERHLRLHGVGREDRERSSGSISRRGVLAMAGPEARARRIAAGATPRASPTSA